MRSLALAAVFAAAVVCALGAALVASPAAAHESDCHEERTCPADDFGYVWYDGRGQGWECTLEAPSSTSPSGAVEVVHEDLVHFCYPVDPERPPAVPATTETATTATTSTTSTGEAIETVEVSPPVTTVERSAPPASAVRSPRDRLDRRAEPIAPRRRALPLVTPLVRPAPTLRPRLTAGGYVFPVYGPAAWVDTYGAPRGNVGWHHGQDIFATLGAPVLAVADGTVFSVGWNDIGGLRLWLRDAQGNEFYYAHLSAFSPYAVNGAKVRAGTVLGFIGNTGDARTTPPHLHFEIHPVSLLGLGYDGSVNAAPYLRAWQRVEDLDAPLLQAGISSVLRAFVGSVPRRAQAPEVAAMLLGSSDISSASGLDARSVRRALTGPGATKPELPRLRGSTTGVGTSALDAGFDGRDQATVEASLRSEAVAYARSFRSLRTVGLDVWDLLARCEAGGRWNYNGSSGFDGGLQFHPDTWSAFRSPDLPVVAYLATREQQIEVARRVLEDQGWAAWPACSARLGLR